MRIISEALHHKVPEHPDNYELEEHRAAFFSILNNDETLKAEEKQGVANYVLENLHVFNSNPFKSCRDIFEASLTFKNGHGPTPGDKTNAYAFSMNRYFRDHSNGKISDEQMHADSHLFTLPEEPKAEPAEVTP